MTAPEHGRTASGGVTASTDRVTYAADRGVRAQIAAWQAAGRREAAETGSPVAIGIEPGGAADLWRLAIRPAESVDLAFHPLQLCLPSGELREHGPRGWAVIRS